MIFFIDSETELGLGLILGSSWFLAGGHIYSAEICAGLFPLPCLTAKPCSLRWGNSVEFHSFHEGKDLFLQSLEHDSQGRWQWTFPQHPWMHRGVMASLAVGALERDIFHPKSSTGAFFILSSTAGSPRSSTGSFLIQFSKILHWIFFHPVLHDPPLDLGGLDEKCSSPKSPRGSYTEAQGLCSLWNHTEGCVCGMPTPRKNKT